MVYRRIVLSYLFAVLATCVLSTPYQEFVANGPDHGDEELRDINSRRIAFSQAINFFNKSYTYGYVNHNGVVSLQGIATYDPDFCSGAKHPENAVIAPFWMNAKKSGHVYFRLVDLRDQESQELLSKPLNAIKEAFPAFANSRWRQALVTTWHNVTRPNSASDYDWLTAQAVIVTAHDKDNDNLDLSFVVLFYDNTPHGNPNTTAFIGFDSGVGASPNIWSPIQQSCENQTSRMEFDNNMRDRMDYHIGQWVYRVDAHELYEPGKLCPALRKFDYGTCTTNDYNPGAVADCVCFQGPHMTTLHCVLDRETPVWAGDTPDDCLVVTTTVGPYESTTAAGSNSSPISFLQTIPVLFLTFLVAFYLC